MSLEIELDDLKAKRQAIADDERDTRQGGRLNLDANETQAVALWAYVASATLSSLSFVMMFFPSVLLYVAETSTERRVALTPLEAFLSLHGGILLGAYALALLFNIPNAAALDLPSGSGAGHPLLVPLTLACGLIAFISYNNTSVGALAFAVFLGSAVIAAWGGWTILFSGTSYISRKTGADKRTSRFLFGNRAAASSQKNEWKKGR